MNHEGSRPASRRRRPRTTVAWTMVNGDPSGSAGPAKMMGPAAGKRKHRKKKAYPQPSPPSPGPRRQHSTEESGPEPARRVSPTASARRKPDGPVGKLEAPPRVVSPETGDEARRGFVQPDPSLDSSSAVSSCELLDDDDVLLARHLELIYEITDDLLRQHASVAAAPYLRATHRLYSRYYDHSAHCLPPPVDSPRCTKL